MQESGHYFKGKKMTGLMRFKKGNESRDFFKSMKLPLVPTLQIRGAVLVCPLQVFEDFIAYNSLIEIHSSKPRPWALKP